MLRPVAFSILLALSAFGPLAHAARQDGLVVYLNFDETERREGDDNSGPLRNLAPNSPVTVQAKGDSIQPTLANDGRFGHAAYFQSRAKAGRINDWAISLGKLDSVYSGSFTVAYWVQAPSSQPAVFFGNKEVANAFAPGILFTAIPNAGFQLKGATGAIIEGSPAGLHDNNWHHVALVVDRTAGTAAFYLDGKPVLDSPKKLNDPDVKLDGGSTTYIGADSSEKNAAKMKVDDFGLWSRALSPAEVLAMGSGAGKRIPEPAAYGAAVGAAGLLAARLARRRRLAK